MQSGYQPRTFRYTVLQYALECRHGFYARTWNPLSLDLSGSTRVPISATYLWTEFFEMLPQII